MSGEEFDRDVLSFIAIDRRAFVKGIVASTAFAVPFVASFSMDALASVEPISGLPTNQPNHQPAPDPMVPFNSLVQGPLNTVVISAVSAVKATLTQSPAGNAVVVGMAIVSGPASVLPILKSKTPHTVTITRDQVIKGKLTHHYVVLHGAVFTHRTLGAVTNHVAKVRVKISFTSFDTGTYA